MISSDNMPLQSAVYDKGKKVESMKKMTAVLMACLLMLCAAGALAQPLLGGWTVADDTGVGKMEKELFDRAMEGLTGVCYEPIAYLGHQTVAGQNHCFLCKATVVYPDAVPTLALVYIYEALDGHAEILHIADLDIAALSVPALSADE